MTRYLLPGLAGAAVAFAVRYIVAGTEVAVVGLFVFAVVYGTILLAARAFAWQDAPTLYAAVAALSVTVAHLVTESMQ